MLRRLKRTYRNKGAIEFFKDSLTYTYWKINRKQTFEIDGYTAVLDGDVDRGGALNRQRFPREREQIKYLLEQTEPSDVVFDVGANIGLYTCFLSQAVLDGKVFGFEPYPPNADQLRRNASYNDGNIRVYEVALSGSPGKINLEVESESPIGVGTASITANDDNDHIAVEQASADALIEEGKLSQPNIVKIDVEGAEPLVIEGMRDALQSDQCRVLMCEVHLEEASDLRPSVHEYGLTPEDFYRRIEKLGFEIETKTPVEEAVHLRATK